MYSGYLDIAGGKHLHYIFVGSETTPATAPVVFWFNGGPGCSSMLGFAQEHGPFLMPDGQNTFQSTLNPHRWNQIAHMVYIESPAGVGYSYVDGTEIPEYTDESSAEDNYLAIVEFFKKFSDLKDNDVYISGESYAGIYVPFLAHKIAVEKKDTNIKLKGFLAGNGVTDLKYDNNALWAMGFWHNIIDKNLEDKLVQNHCFPKELSVYIVPTKEPSPACSSLYQEFETKMAEVNIYDLY